MTELPKTFDPAAIEQRWYAHWESRGLFRPERPDATPWTIVMPPPNVTGSLHIGHALDNTLQDILTRRERMLGKDALWVVGTDHAGIATQMVVERNLESQGVHRADIGREAFLEHVWEWKAQSGGAITRQLRRLGASCDWAHERFTMDEGFCRAVTKVFVELYRRGLAYRDKRLVNWDPKFQTAISDLEVETRDVQGKFWTLRYPLEDGSGEIHVATTRPETMLADMAVAVHPEDSRYKAMVGKKVRLPITGRLIPIVTDEHADPELGSGAVKITPGHDFNDYEVGKRAGFAPRDMLNMFDATAHVVQTQDGLIPPELLGLSREEARKRVVEMLEAESALVSVEDRVIPTPYGDRSGVVIEPWLTDQWYVDAAKLVVPVLEATRKGDIRIVPETWKKTWFNWLENIQPWCVSRQLWWGHRIPAWFGPEKDETYYEIAEGGVGNEKVFVSDDEASIRAEAAAYYGLPEESIILDTSSNAGLTWLDAPNPSVVLWQDEDVLDTWFSSALWPFATLGWPDDAEETLSPAGRGQGEGEPTTEDNLGSRAPSSQPSPRGGEGAVRRWTPKSGTELARHYPNDVLISGFDILFFWDARMAMQGMEFMGEVPWRTLYLHGLVRDAHGQKMSKSKGNTVDPLGLIDKYGADALRFTLAAMESQGRDIKLDEKRVEGYRNFATKLWNAARFLQMNGVGASQSIAAPAAELPVNRWIIGEVVETLAKLDRAFDELRYDEMADAIYHFTWGTFCDWYVELVKGQFDEETRRVAAWAFDQILVMLHPLMPFITEELWHAMGERPYELIVAKWPEPQVGPHPKQAEFDSAMELVKSELGLVVSRDLDQVSKFEVERQIEVISQVRALRAELNIPWSATLTPVVVGNNPEVGDMFEEAHATFSRLAKIGLPEFSAEIPAESAQIVVAGTTVAFPLEGIVDLDAEKARLAKAAAAAEKERDSLAARLANPNFVDRAKPEAVEKARSDHAEKSAEAERYRAALERLG